MDNFREEEKTIKDLISKGFLATMRDNYRGLERVLKELDLLIGNEGLSQYELNQVLDSWLIEFNYFQFAKSNLPCFTQQYSEVLLQLAIKVNSYKSADSLMQHLQLVNNTFLDPYIILAIKSGSRECLDLLIQFLDSPDSMLLLERTDVLTLALSLGRHEIAESLSNDYSYAIDELPKHESGHYTSLTEQISSLTYIIKSKVLNDLQALSMVRLAYERYGSKIQGIDGSVYDKPIIAAIKRASTPLLQYLFLYLEKDRLDPIQLMSATIGSHASIFSIILILDMLFEEFEVGIEHLTLRTQDLIQAVLKESRNPIELLGYFIDKGISIQSITEICNQTDHQYIIDKLIQERYS